MPDLPTSSSARTIPPAVVFVGTRGHFSPAPLAALIAGGVNVRAVLVPTPAPPGRSATDSAWRPLYSLARSRLPLLANLTDPTIVDLAEARGIPVIAVSALDRPEIMDELRRLQPDLVCVACLPWLVPPELLAVPRYGWLNLHPSLLPANRGPAPLFWTFRLGERLTGVTVHLMDQAWDTGSILAQETIVVPEGVSGRSLEAMCAARGGDLLLSAVRAAASGTARPIRQDEADGSYHPWPRAEDFQFTPEHSARWAYNFIRGVDDWGTSPELLVAGERYRVRAALSYDPVGTLGAPYQRRGEEIQVQCRPGILHLAVY